MAQALPVAKLATLLVKTIAKPLSKRIKHEFSQYKITSQALINVGQASHNITSRLTIWSAGYKVRSITPLEEDKALTMGAEVVGESFVLLVSIGTIVFEANRSWEKDRIKSEKQKQEAAEERRALQAQLHALDLRLDALEQMVLTSSVIHCMLPTPIGLKWNYKPPPQSEIVPILKPSYDDNQTANDTQLVYSAAKGKGPSGKSIVDANGDQQLSVGVGSTGEAQSSESTSSTWRWPPW